MEAFSLEKIEFPEPVLSLAVLPKAKGDEEAGGMDEDFVNALKEQANIRQALLSLNLAPKGGNYTRAKTLMQKYNIQK